MSNLEQILAEQFVCAKCGQQMARVKTLAMSGKGLTRLFDWQLYNYLFVTCQNCGYTETYDPKVLAQLENTVEALKTIFAMKR